ncbi:MAG: hypothetical protein RL160_709 [Bacteroidota bacterium]|jgi:nicotinamide-nucleotide amidase
MNAEIITVGDELLIGQTVDTNSAWLGTTLNSVGIWVSRRTAVGDQAEAIRAALDEAFARVDLVLMTGGLGPTKDDITKKTLCAYFQCGYRLDDTVLNHLTQLFSKRGRKLLEINKMQAELPEACSTLMNHMGTAPGMWFDQGGKVLVSMPGVPYEMKHITETAVIPRIKERFTLPSIVHRTLTVINVPESALSKELEPWELSLPDDIKLAYLPQLNTIRLRLTTQGADQNQLQQRIEPYWEALRTRCAAYLLAETDTTAVAQCAEELMQQAATLSLAESCTGGNIAHLFTLIPGISTVLLGGVVAYANQLKTNLLQVPEAMIAEHGAVSGPVVSHMAERIRAQTGSDYAIATSGIAGPGGGSELKPVGTVWIAVSAAQGTSAQQWHFYGTREHIIERATNTACHQLLMHLKAQAQNA